MEKNGKFVKELNIIGDNTLVKLSKEVSNQNGYEHVGAIILSIAKRLMN